MAASMSKDVEMIYKEVADSINDILGDNLGGLEKAKEFADKLKNDKADITTRLSVASDEVPSKLSQALSEVDDIIAKMEELKVLQKQFDSHVTTHLARVEPIVNDLKQPIKEITLIEHYVRYLHWIQMVHDASSDIQTALLVKSESRAVSRFRNLCELCCSLTGSKCYNLVNFIKVTVQFWHKLLKDKFTREFEEVLKVIKWPFLQPMTVDGIKVQDAEILVQFETYFLHLLHIQLPDEIFCSSPALQSPFRTKSVILPMQLLLRPLKKRFLYHFQGNKETNNVAKPEWYFTQILSWIRDHGPFLDNTVQNILDKAGLIGINAKVEFMCGLMQLVIEKLNANIEVVLYNDRLITHTINETLLFDKELRTYGYPSAYPNCLLVLTKDPCFTRWLNMERKSAVEKMDTIMAQELAWKTRFQDHGEIDDFKVPHCAENFMTLILTITERYKALPHPGHRLQFLDLQLELLDDFRLRLQQLLKEEAREPLESNYCAILNSCFYIIQVLRDWSELPFFIQTQYYKLQYETVQSQLQLQMSSSSQTFVEANDYKNFLANDVYDDWQQTSQIAIPDLQKEALESLEENFSEDKLESMTGTVFEKIIDLLDHMKEDMLRKLSDYVTSEVKTKSYSYRTDKWFSMPSPKDYITPSLTSSACSMLLALKVQLHKVKNSLSYSLFHKLWQFIAEELNSYFYYEFILQNRFNEGGCTQVYFDITRNLFPIFGGYTRKPENYFRELKEACLLLALPKGSAILLLDALKSSSSDVADPKQALAEQGIHKLAPIEATSVLNTRTELNIL